jgi:hypothetical protein
VASTIEEDLGELDRKLKQLKLDYEKYFLGTRPRAPVLLRGDVQKMIHIFSNTPIQNTGLRFRFNSICSRFQAFKRQWDDTLRKIEDGTYKRHRFKADLHEKQRLEKAQAALNAEPDGTTPAGGGAPDLFDDYRSARETCGQGVTGLTQRKLSQVIEKQKSQLRQRFGEESNFRFRVVVEDGKAKLKASRIKEAG